MKDFYQCVVLVTCPDAASAEKLSEALVIERLAACVNTTQVSSLFHWHGKVERSTEQLLIVKTHQDLLDDLNDRIHALHPYDVPEIIALPIIGGSEDYLDWIDENLDKEHV